MGVCRETKGVARCYVSATGTFLFRAGPANIRTGQSKRGPSTSVPNFLEDVVERRAEHGKLRHLCRSSSHGALTYIEDGLRGS